MNGGKAQSPHSDCGHIISAFCLFYYWRLSEAADTTENLFFTKFAGNQKNALPATAPPPKPIDIKCNNTTK
jgi:hypothetical protein